MSFWTLYLLALLPLIIGGVAFLRNSKEFTWAEWLVNTIICFLVAGAFHFGAIHSNLADTETWSGQVTYVEHQASWKEYYEDAVYKTVHHSSGYGKNRRTWTTREFSHWRSCTRTHNAQFYAHTNLPDEQIWITKDQYLDFGGRLGGQEIHTPGDRKTSSHNSKMIGGDPNDHRYNNTSNHIIPVNKTYSWENRVKASSSLFSFPKVPDGVKLFDYPVNDNPFASNRLLGSANLVDSYIFDQMNARLGPTKHVNVIFVGMGDTDSMNGKWQEAKWLGGKKNDVVLVWGGSNDKPAWTQAFGWTDEKLTLRNLETEALLQGITTKTLPVFEQIIVDNYKLKNWHDFDYLTIPVSTGWVVAYVIFQLASQIGLFYWYHRNDIKQLPVVKGRLTVLPSVQNHSYRFRR